MALSNSYLTGTKNLSDILNAIRSAQAPERFTIRFLQDLGFKTTSDRLIVSVLKSLGFIDESGVPKQRYHQFLDSEISSKVLAEGIRDAYGDLFALNIDANTKDQTWVRNKLKTLSQGTKSDAVISKMALTFTALCKLGDFTKTSKMENAPVIESGTAEPKPTAAIDSSDVGQRSRTMELVYKIHIELPAVRDQGVYDAIFKSLRENLL